MLLLIVFDVEAVRHSVYDRESRKIDVMNMNREVQSSENLHVTLSLVETIRL